MKITIPLTGTVVATKPCLVGDDNDPIRPLDLDLGAVKWRMVEDSIDLENGTCVIDVEPNEDIEERSATLDAITELIYNHTREELYTLSGNSPLRKPFEPTVEP